MNYIFKIFNFKMRKKDDENDENLKKLKASYETLVKFSFLAQEGILSFFLFI